MMRGLNIRWGALPANSLMTVMVVAPLLIMLVVSFLTKGPYGGVENEFSTRAYSQLLFEEGWSGETEFNPQFIYIVVRTVLLAGATTFLCLLIGFPVAYFIAQRHGRMKAFLIYLVTLPFWISMIVRVYAWLIILGNDGVLEKTLRALGLVDDMGSLLFNSGAMLVGMVYSYIPLMILPIFASIEKLDSTLVEASHDLYAGGLRTLFKVIIPLSAPGIVAGSILVFVPSLGAVLEPTILGGGKQLVLGNLVQTQFGSARDWPFGAAISMTLLALAVIVLVAIALRRRTFTRGGA